MKKRSVKTMTANAPCDTIMGNDNLSSSRRVVKESIFNGEGKTCFSGLPFSAKVYCNNLPTRSTEMAQNRQGLKLLLSSAAICGRSHYLTKILDEKNLNYFVQKIPKQTLRHYINSISDEKKLRTKQTGILLFC